MRLLYNDLQLMYQLQVIIVGSQAQAGNIADRTHQLDVYRKQTFVHISICGAEVNLDSVNSVNHS